MYIYIYISYISFYGMLYCKQTTGDTSCCVKNSLPRHWAAALWIAQALRRPPSLGPRADRRLLWFM